MTNYSQRLDETLARLHQQYEMQFGMHKQQFNNKKIKQALTSLIKELVAEAKPAYGVMGGEIQRIRNGGRNNAIDQFEQNLLKALGNNGKAE